MQEWPVKWLIGSFKLDYVIPHPSKWNPLRCRWLATFSSERIYRCFLHNSGQQTEIFNLYFQHTYPIQIYKLFIYITIKHTKEIDDQWMEEKLKFTLPWEASSLTYDHIRIPNRTWNFNFSRQLDKTERHEFKSTKKWHKANYIN